LATANNSSRIPFFLDTLSINYQGSDLLIELLPNQREGESMNKLIYLTILLISFQAQATVFKCATPTGFIYSEKPCQKDARALDIHMLKPTETGSSEVGGSSGKLLEQMRTEERTRKSKKDAMEKAAWDKEEALKETKKNKCTQAKKRLSIYQSSGRVVRQDENGKDFIVDENMRTTIMNEIQNDIATNCDS